jgi:hypothetical protein
VARQDTCAVTLQEIELLVRKRRQIVQNQDNIVITNYNVPSALHASLFGKYKVVDLLLFITINLDLVRNNPVLQSSPTRSLFNGFN